MADYVQIMLTRGFGSFCQSGYGRCRERLASDDDKVDDLFDIILSHTTGVLKKPGMH